MVEGDVAEGDVDLEVGCVGDPLTESLGEHQVVVGVGDNDPHVWRHVHRGHPLWD
jgi:hypothetical protein